MSEEKGLTEYLNEYLSGGQVQLPVSNMTGLRLQQEISKEGANSKEIEKLVNLVLSAKKADPAADTSALEEEIDRLVYELYGLTEEEIKIVEGK